MKRRLFWGVLTLALMAASFGVGRAVKGARSVPELVATLPGDEAGFSHEFDERIRARFPIGSSEDALLAYLRDEGFAPDWRRRDGASAAEFVSNGIVCRKVIRVDWRADASGILTDVNGAYESQCL